MFTRSRSGTDKTYSINVEPLDLVEVVSDAASDLRFPTYSPDGKSLLFQAAHDAEHAELRIFETETKKIKTLLKMEDAEANPRFSPDGQWIAFQNRIDGNAEICRVPAAGGEIERLTSDPARDISPAWSPDGSRIVFASNRGESYSIYQLFLMNADGSDQHRIYYSKAISQAPSWSPDGRQIIFANDKEDNRSGNFEIFAIEPETVNPERRLTFHRRYDVNPVFSPDGARIAFASNADGNSEIYVMRADGTGLLRLTRDRAEDQFPSWSVDGRRIIFCSDRGGRSAIYEIQVD
jgi:TolB protein